MVAMLSILATDAEANSKALAVGWRSGQHGLQLMTCMQQATHLYRHQPEVGDDSMHDAAAQPLAPQCKLKAPLQAPLQH